MYIELADAIDSLAARQDSQIIEDYLKRKLPSGVPDFLDKDGRNFVLFRNVASPNFEALRFLSRGDSYSGAFKTIIFEYTKDRFFDQNPLKHSLGKLSFISRHDKNGNPILRSRVILEFASWNNFPIAEVTTKSQESLVDFHHRLIKGYLKPHASVHDGSDWLKRHGETARSFYEFVLLIFLKDAILFENFVTCGREGVFTNEVVRPAIDRISQDIGVQPLIVQLLFGRCENDKYWSSYPGVLEEQLARPIDGGPGRFA